MAGRSKFEYRRDAFQGLGLRSSYVRREVNVCKTRTDEIAAVTCPMHILQQISCRLVNMEEESKPAKT